MISVLLLFELSRNWTSVFSRRLERSWGTHKWQVQFCIIDWNLTCLLLYSTLLIIIFVLCLKILHIFNTKSIRNEIGYEVIKKAIEKLGLRHKEHISAYGEGKEQRLTGWHETADISTFKWVRGKWNNFLAATRRKMSCINLEMVKHWEIFFIFI